MAIISSKVKELHELYLTGMALQDISKKMHIKYEDVLAFIPKGEEGLAYERVIEARGSLDTAEMARKDVIGTINSLLKSGKRLDISLNMFDTSITEYEAELKLMRRARKKIVAHASNIEGRRNDLIELKPKYEQDAINARDEFEKSVMDKNDVVTLFNEKRMKAQERILLIKKAEQVTKETIILEAIEKAKGMVEANVDRILERREKEILDIKDAH